VERGIVTLYTRRAIIIIPAAKQAQASALAVEADPGTDGRTFTVPLSATGTLPASHYWCNWQTTQAQWDALMARFPDGKQGVRYFDADTTTPEQALDATGLRRITSGIV
jgi:hypothetical protein